MSFYDAIRVGASGAADFEVERSLRFNDDDGAYLQETAGTPTNNKIWTYSVWVKRTTLSGDQAILVGYSNGGSFDQILFSSSGGRDNQLFMQFNNSGTYGQFTSTRLFRDVGAWGHLVIKADTTAASNGVTVYWNNEVVAGTWNVTLAQDATFHSLNQSGDNFRIGHLDSGVANHYLDGYLAEVNFVDGQALNPSSFAETNSATGQWVPIDTSGLTFGNNGFRLNFSDNSGTTATTLGKDYSGNGNNFTPNNFSVSAGSGNDSLEDSPTNNFATFNPLHTASGTNFATFSNGNLDHSLAVSQNAVSSFLIPKTGKWYAEYVLTAGALLSYMGVRNPNLFSGVFQMQFTDDGSSLSAAAQVRVDNTYTETLSSSYANNDILGIKVDRDAGTIQFTKNGTNNSTAVSLSGASDTSDLVFFIARSQSGSYSFAGSVNFGQRPFSYLPTGYKSLCSANLPDPTILLPEKHYNTLVITGNQSTNAVTGLDFQPDWVVYKALNPETGHGETWFHDAIRGPTVRQGIRPYNTTTPPAEVTNASYLVSFDSNGLTVGSDGVYNNYHQYNQTGRLYQALCWDVGETDGKTYTVTVVDSGGNKFRFDGFAANAVTLDLAEGGTYIFNYPSGHPFRFSTTADGTHGGGSEYTTGVTHNSSTQVTIVVAASAPQLYYYCASHSGMGGAVNTNSTLGSSNFDGATQSRVKTSPLAGISLVTYTGTGSTTTVGHGLGAKPDFMIFRNRNSEGHDWLVYHKRLGATKNLKLNKNDPEQTASNKFNDTEPTSTVFTLNTAADSNQSGETIMSYHFTEIEGYSKFGFYSANSNNDGPFAYCGFRPAFLLIKRRTSGDNNPWIGYNNVRNPFNQVNNQMVWNTTEWENIDANNCNLDFLSNGFKLRNSSGTFNNSGSSGEYIFIAFAHSPFKNSRAR